ncbi:hypothetical protein RJ55_01731 [Drechmeria coniospora]|nr:hypothetical protein RJ55_01731 [Drechmeria coniospora]
MMYDDEDIRAIFGGLELRKNLSNCFGYILPCTVLSSSCPIMDRVNTYFWHPARRCNLMRPLLPLYHHTLRHLFKHGRVGGGGPPRVVSLGGKASLMVRS